MGLPLRLGLSAAAGLEGQRKARVPTMAPEWPGFAAVSAKAEDQDRGQAGSTGAAAQRCLGVGPGAESVSRRAEVALPDGEGRSDRLLLGH